MAGPKSVFEMVHISSAEIAGDNNFATSFREIGLFICSHIYLYKQLLPQINSCCLVVRVSSSVLWFKYGNWCFVLVPCYVGPSWVDCMLSEGFACILAK